MTLIDSRPGIHATLRALSAETGVFIDADAAVERLGPPLDEELARWYPADAVAATADRFRALYVDYAIEPVKALPGAAESYAAIHAVAVAVATGPVSAADLRSAGADVVLADLRGFPAWLDGYLAA